MTAKLREDPFVALLDELAEKTNSEGQSDAWRGNAIASLYAYCDHQSTIPFDALSAVILAGKLRIPAPESAIAIIDKAVHDCLRQGSLDVAFGMKGKGTGKTLDAAIPKRLRRYMLDDLCEQVHQLILKGKTQTEACRLVARSVDISKKVAGHPSIWANMQFNIRRPNKNTLMGIYRTWRDTRECVQKQLDQFETARLAERTLQAALRLRARMRRTRSIINVDTFTRRVLDKAIEQLTLVVYSQSGNVLRPFSP